MTTMLLSCRSSIPFCLAARDRHGDIGAVGRFVEEAFTDKLFEHPLTFNISTCHSRHACETVSCNPGISPYSPRTRRTSASSGTVPGFRDSESAFVLQPMLDFSEPPFTGPQRRRTGVYRVRSEHDVVCVRRRRRKHGPRIGVRTEVASCSSAVVPSRFSRSVRLGALAQDGRDACANRVNRAHHFDLRK
jgi:hypothetical protein